jgi:transcriptional antiterminator NusG
MSPDDTGTDNVSASLDESTAAENGANGQDPDTGSDDTPEAQADAIGAEADAPEYGDEPVAATEAGEPEAAEAEYGEPEPVAATDAGEPEAAEAGDVAEAEVSEPDAIGVPESEVEAPAVEAGVAEAEAGAPDAIGVPEAESDVGESEVEAPEVEAGVAEAEPGEPDAIGVPEAESDVRESGVEAPEVEAPEVEAGVAEAEAGEPDAIGVPEAGAGDAGEAEVLTDEQLLAESAIVVDNPYTRPGRWFVVHTQSGYEKKVKQNLEARIHSMNAEEAVYEVVIPMEDYVDFKNGKRVVAQRKMFPGYLLVRAELDDTAWFVIRNTPGVTGFVGQGAKPSPLPRRDVEAFLTPKGTEEQIATRAKPRLEYEIGETVRVREGPFADFSGEVIEINEDQLKLKVLVNIFGRETPVELEFSKVAKL